MDEFEHLLSAHLQAVKRYVHYRCRNAADAEDILQEVLLLAHQRFKHPCF